MLDDERESSAKNMAAHRVSVAIQTSATSLAQNKTAAWLVSLDDNSSEVSERRQNRQRRQATTVLQLRHQLHPSDEALIFRRKAELALDTRDFLAALAPQNTTSGYVQQLERVVRDYILLVKLITRTNSIV